jgi:hypothetical protein
MPPNLHLLHREASRWAVAKCYGSWIPSVMSDISPVNITYWGDAFHILSIILPAYSSLPSLLLIQSSVSEIYFCIQISCAGRRQKDLPPVNRTYHRTMKGRLGILGNVGVDF